MTVLYFFFFFFQAEDGIRDYKVTGVQTCALPILKAVSRRCSARRTSPRNLRSEESRLASSTGGREAIWAPPNAGPTVTMRAASTGGTARGYRIMADAGL